MFHQESVGFRIFQPENSDFNLNAVKADRLKPVLYDTIVIMSAKTPYRTYKTYLTRKYGASAYRIGVDGGFSCPNRTPDGLGGCTYCDDTGAIAVYHRQKEAGEAQKSYSNGSPGIGVKSYYQYKPLVKRKEYIKMQIEQAKKFLETRYRAQLFLLYFQAFSSTFDEVFVLKELYDYALSLMEFKELIVSTRPDCLDIEKIRLLASYREKVGDVWVELGLQTSVNATLERINRGHTVEKFVEIFRILRSNGIKISVHVILGLPGESYAEIARTADLITELHPESVKIHNLHIPDNTHMLKEYLHGELLVPSTARHLSYTTCLLERIPDDIIIQRLTCDTPSHRLAAPRVFQKKGAFISQLGKKMSTNNNYQGRYLEKSVGT